MKIKMNEQELELQLSQYNKKLNLYDTIYRKTPIPFIRNSVAKKIIRVRDKRDKCFKDLRTLIREKHPEQFIGYNYGKR